MMSNSTPTGSVDEQIDEILDEHFEHGAFNPATNGERFKVYQEQYRKEAREKLLHLINEARKEGYKKGVKILAWRIDCCTLISELSGWRGAVEMAEEEALNQMEAQIDRTTKTKETTK